MKIYKIQTKNLTNILINKIIYLKNTEWKHGLKSNLSWFKKNIRKNDIHILLLKKNHLIAYNVLRKRIFIINKKKYNYYYFDTLIVDKKFRGKNLVKKIINQNIKIYKKIKIPMFLLCRKKLVHFYKKNNWFLLNNKKRYIFKDFKHNKNIMIFATQRFIKKFILPNKVFLFLNK